MKVLDLDMDYFLNDIASGINSENNERLNENKYIPWSRKQVENFLENNLGLDKNHKIEGKIVTHHHEALYYWRDLIGNEKLNTPFDVIHVDSHADLGVGYRSWAFMYKYLLGLPVDKRPEIEHYKDIFEEYQTPDIGDYLLFTIAFRWIKSLTYICNPISEGNDYVLYTLKNFKEPNDKIQLLYNNINKISDLEDEYKRKLYYKNSKLEPSIPFNIIRNVNSVNFDGNFDFITFSQSPNYTPKSADFIIDIIKQYFK